MNIVRGARFTLSCLLFTTAATMLGLFAAPAMAGVAAAPALDPVGRLELQFDNSVQQFLLVDDTASVVAGPQSFFDGGALSNGQRGLLILDPEFDDTAPTPDMLVTFGNSPSQATIDEGKLAIGAGKRTGNDRGFITSSDTLRIDFPLLAVADPVFQVEVKQDVAAKIVFLLNGTQVGEPHYLLSGGSVASPPSEVPTGDPDRVCKVNELTDGGADSGNNDDGLCELPKAPLHNAEIWTVINGGKLAIKGGGEYPVPGDFRTSWDAYALDGFLDCGDEFASDGGEVTGRRAITNVGGGCTSLIGYDIEFDSVKNEVSFEVVDPDNQNLGTIFDVEFEPQPLGSEDDETLLSYTDAIDCDNPLVTDPTDPNQATRSCIGLQTCVGQPIRACSDSGNSCSKDSDCDVATGESCDTLQLIPPVGGFPDLVLSTPAPATEYGCVLEETVIYLGSPGSCSLDSSISCATDSDCDAGVCNLVTPEVQVLQEIFIFDDVRFGRR